MNLSNQSHSDGLLFSLGYLQLTWDIASDAVSWSGNVAEALPGFSGGALSSGREIATRIEPAGIRAATIVNSTLIDQGDGVRYRIEYALRPEPSAAGDAAVTWVEEIGRWFAGADGKPARAQGVVHVINERRARDEQLVKLSQHDPLTGELNRTCLIASLAESIEECLRFRTSFALMLIAIDDLAHINDSFGFDVADEVIQDVARRIRARLRSGDVLGRFSGNKFGIVLKNCTMDDMNVCAERFLSGIRDEIVPTRSGPVAVTISIGGVNAPRYARTVEDAVNRAQEALDMTKGRRRGAFSAWRPSAEREAQRRVNIRVTDEIVTALNDRRLAIAFEPVVSADTRVPAFHECLVRMRHGENLMLASDIVPVAEKLGLIRLVDHRVLQLVLDELAAAPSEHLSLNISPDTTADPDWWANVESSIRAFPGVGERMIVEITETVAIRDINDVRGFVTRLKDFGCRIAIDDFGAGYTSFRNLRKLGVDIVKIDGAFVQNMARSPDDRAFVQTLIDLARRLDLKTVAEWVQDEASAALLRDWGCDYLQGRLIGLAAPEPLWRSGIDHPLAANAVAAS